MIAGATKIWYYVPEHKRAAFEDWLNRTRPGYIENLEAGQACVFHSIFALIPSLPSRHQQHQSSLSVPNLHAPYQPQHLHSVRHCEP